MNELDLDLGFTEEEAGPRGRRRYASRRRRERRKRRKGRAAALLAVIIIFAILGGAAWAGYAVVHGITYTPDYSGAGSGNVLVHIESGASTRSIAVTLEKDGVVKSTKAFNKAAADNPDSMGIQPGYYRMNKHMAAALALNRLLDPSARVLSRVTVPEGMRAANVLALLAEKTRIPLAKFQAATRHPGALGLPASAHGRLEGYLFPATYDIPPKSTPSSILSMMIDRYLQEEVERGLATKAHGVGLTTHQLLTVASLLEMEARPKDYTKVARVIYNRDHVSKPLQLDSTVLYAQSKAGTLKVSTKDTRYPSPYNTYLHAGLPPGPIDNPGAAAVDAAAHPAAGNWTYFITVNPKTGDTRFTNSYAEFQKWKIEFKKNNP
ncbi:MAG: endolytic transglycosylase MltG [Streptosporangiales bacterium]|nr:endolytic transglycosylase MltG [Streptosporangiales bacterium]MBO0891149.1 endolytic transglycosylase MltG [Acidothermales bacterium]